MRPFNFEVVTTTIATDALGAYGLASDDAETNSRNLQKVMDLMLKTSQTTNTNVTQMFEAVTVAAPIFKSAGQSAETFNTVLGVMANSGIKASVAGTALKNAMNNLQAPTKSARESLAALGVKTRDNNGNLLDFIDILDQVKKGQVKVSKATFDMALKNIFGLRAIAPMNKLLDEGTEKLKAYREVLKSAGGTTKETAAFMSQSLLSSLKRLKASFSQVGASIMTMDAGLVGFIDRVALNVAQFAQFISTNEALITSFMSGAGTIIKYTAVLGGLILAVKGLRLALGLLSAHPLVAAFVGMVALGTWAQNRWNELSFNRDMKKLGPGVELAERSKLLLAEGRKHKQGLDDKKRKKETNALAREEKRIAKPSALRETETLIKHIKEHKLNIGLDRGLKATTDEPLPLGLNLEVAR